MEERRKKLEIPGSVVFFVNVDIIYFNLAIKSNMSSRYYQGLLLHL